MNVIAVTDQGGEVLPDLSPDERARLQADEAVIRGGLGTFRNVGEALFDIQRARLYRGTHATFEAYLKDRWAMDRSYGYRLIDAFKAADAVDMGGLSPIGDTVPNEHVARVLVPLLRESSDRVAEGWATVVDRHEGEGPITATEAKRTLVSEGYLPDTSGATGKPNWNELLGSVGDTLVRAGKQMDVVEAAVKRPPGTRFRANAERYAGWADDLAARLRAW